MRAAHATGHMQIQLGIVHRLVGEQLLNYIYALHGCSSAGLLSIRASRSFPRRIWLFTVFNGKPIVSAMSSYRKSSK